MDDKLEATYEARPWRWYVLDVPSMKVIASTGLAPFNMKGKIAKLKEATAPATSATDTPPVPGG